MELHSNGTCWSWAINDKFEDVIAAKHLGINYDKYINILEKYGAIAMYSKSEQIHYFYNPLKFENFLNSEEMVPYLIMEKLTE